MSRLQSIRVSENWRTSTNNSFKKSGTEGKKQANRSTRMYVEGSKYIGVLICILF